MHDLDEQFRERVLRQIAGMFEAILRGHRECGERWTERELRLKDNNRKIMEKLILFSIAASDQDQEKRFVRSTSA